MNKIKMSTNSYSKTHYDRMRWYARMWYARAEYDTKAKSQKSHLAEELHQFILTYRKVGLNALQLTFWLDLSGFFVTLCFVMGTLQGSIFSEFAQSRWYPIFNHYGKYYLIVPWGIGVAMHYVAVRHFTTHATKVRDALEHVGIDPALVGPSDDEHNKLKNSELEDEDSAGHELHQ